MGGRIPRQFIDDLIGRVDIVQVIDERVPLRKAGRDYVACCPFHGEKTPSFTVSPDKQFYHCFGCGAHGTAIGFLMEYGHMEFPDAVRELAARAGLQVPSEGGDAAQPDLSPLYSVLEEAAGFFRRQLRTHPAASRAVQYLKSRGLSGQTAAEFGLGYAPPGWEELTVALGAGRAELLAQAGLVLAGRSEGGKPYDRFRDRVMFPILDRQGRTVGFGGRTIGDGTPKYLNSPETPVFHKGREVYGLHRARRLERQPARLVVVEGYMDVLALAEFGVPGAVATLGTAATAEQLSQMFRLTPHLLFCFDGDDAGRRAAWRALETVLPLLGEGRQASFAFLPEKEDPDSLVRREGASAFEERLRSATGLPELLFARIAGQVDLGTLDGRARLVDLARPLLARLPAGALRQLMHQRLAELAQMEPPELSALLRGAGRPARRATPAARAAPIGDSPLVRRALQCLVHRPSLAAEAGEHAALARVRLAGIEGLVAVLDALAERPDLRTAGLIERFRDSDLGAYLARLAAAPDPAAEGVSPEAEWQGAMRGLRLRLDEERLDELQRKLRSDGLSAQEKVEYGRLLRAVRPGPC